jgi:hypothetical protein
MTGDTRPLDPVPEPDPLADAILGIGESVIYSGHNYPGRHGAYGVQKVCASCGVEYRGPSYSGLCWGCFGDSLRSSTTPRRLTPLCKGCQALAERVGAHV